MHGEEHIPKRASLVASLNRFRSQFPPENPFLITEYLFIRFSIECGLREQHQTGNNRLNFNK